MSSQKIKAFLRSSAFAVVGASNSRQKFGNKVLRCYLQHHKIVYPVNPGESQIEGLACVKTLADLPDTVESISIITPPLVTEEIVTQAIEKGIRNLWMQPGAESEEAIERALKHHINLIAKGPCILVELGFKE